MSNVSQWSTTDASNNAAPPDGAPPATMTVPQIDDTMRAMFGALARFYEHLDGSLVTAGSSNAFTIDTSSDHAALADQSVIVARADRAPTGAATLKVDDLAAKAIKVNHDEDVGSSTWDSGQMLVFVYNATDNVYELIGPSIPKDGAITTAKLADSAITEAKISTFPLPRGYLAGLGTSNGTDADHDIDIAAGAARDSSNAFNFTISSTHTKRIDASWASGSGNGGLASAVSLSTGTWYHLFLVDDGNGNTEAGFDTSVTATDLLSDTGGSYYRRIASVLTDGSSNILGYLQSGDEFVWDVPIDDLVTGTIGSAGTALTLSVPTGVRVIAHFNATYGTQVRSILFYPPDTTGAAPASSNNPVGQITGASVNEGGNQVRCLTNTSSQVKGRVNGSNNTDASITTTGWQDRRGRDD